MNRVMELMKLLKLTQFYVINTLHIDQGLINQLRSLINAL